MLKKDGCRECSVAKKNVITNQIQLGRISAHHAI